MNESLSLRAILASQQQWAKARQIEVSAAYRTMNLESNLFNPLSAESRSDFEDGAGCELDGDLLSLRSSAALVCNVFEPWKAWGPGAIAELCGGEARASALRFEQKFPTGLAGTPPHLDVVFTGEATKPLGIESKFTEIYGEPHNAFANSYLDSKTLWRDLPRCREFAVEIWKGGITLKRLGAAQLLKHALGLQRKHGPRGFRLLYLWYEVPGGESDDHRDEVSQFEAVVRADLDFLSLTHQELFRRLKQRAADRPAYLDYLQSRYFP